MVNVAAYQTAPTTVVAHQSAPTVGIAIPSYRAADTLEETLRSCVSQTFTDWVAYVTVDGEDMARESEVVDRIGDPRIHVECNHGRLGQMPNFNRAILRCYRAGAKWIKTFSADDLLYPEALERMLEVGNRNTNCGLVFGYFDVIDESGTKITAYEISQLESQIIPREVFRRRVAPFGNPTGGPSSVMIRANVIEHSGLFDGRLDYAGDRDFWFRIACHFDVGVVGRRPILAYRRHNNSVSAREHTKAIFFREMMDIGRRMACAFPPYSRQWFLSQVYLGRMGGTNLVTALAFAKSRKFSNAIVAAKTTLQRLSPLSLPIALWHCGRIIATGIPAGPTPFEPVSRTHTFEDCQRL